MSSEAGGTAVTDRVWALAALKVLRDASIQNVADIPGKFLEWGRADIRDWIDQNVLTLQDVAQECVELLSDDKIGKEAAAAAGGNINLESPPRMIRWRILGRDYGAYRQQTTAASLAVDATWSKSEDELGFMDNQGPKYSKNGNSCAFDAVCALMARMRAGITRFDQLPLECLQYLEPVPSLSQKYVQTHWKSDMDMGGPRGRTIDDLRNIISQEYVKQVNSKSSNVAEHTRIDHMQSVSEVVQAAMAGLPQVECLLVNAQWCRGCRRVIDGSVKNERGLVMLTVQRFEEQPAGMTVERILQEYFLASKSAGGYYCGRCAGGGDIRSSVLVARELPPRVMLECYLDPTVENRAKFDPFTVTYKRADESGVIHEVQGAYKLTAFVLYDDSNKHFTTWWRVGEEWAEHDSLKRKGRWTAGMDRAAMLDRAARRGRGTGQGENYGCPFMVFERIYPGVGGSS